MRKLVKLIILLGLAFLSFYYIFDFFNSIEVFGVGAIEVKISRMLTILTLNILFISLMFLIDYKRYRQLFLIIIIVAGVGWLIIYLYQFFDLQIDSKYFKYIWDSFLFLTYSIIGPGVIIYTIYYIEKSTEKLENSQLFGYHIHEGFVGLILIISALILLPSHSFMVNDRIFYNELVVFLGAIQFLIYGLLFVGGFFVFRDWRDVIRFKLIEKKDPPEKIENNDNSTSVFTNVTEADLPFFKLSRLNLYSLGITLSSFSISAIIWGTNFLPYVIFKVPYDTVVILGFILSFFGGSLIGVDWVRIYRRYCPKQYQELEDVINNLKNHS